MIPSRLPPTNTSISAQSSARPSAEPRNTEAPGSNAAVLDMGATTAAVSESNVCVPTQAALQAPRPSPSAANLEMFRQRVLKEWTDSITVAGWRKWHTPFSKATAAVSEMCVQAADIRPGVRVLDLASGSGEPAITVARAVGAEGHVVASDLGEGMLGIADEEARKAGMKNMSSVPASMERLPFADDSFDRVTCRWGLMFVPDHVQALREINRVLKPGGRVVIIAWGTPKQPFFAPLHALMKRNLLPAPLPGAPSPLKFSVPNSLTQAMQEAGLSAINETAPTLPFDWPGTPESFFEWFYDIAAPFRGLFDSLDKETFEAVKGDICDSLRPHVEGDLVRPGANVVVGVAQSSKA